MAFVASSLDLSGVAVITGGAAGFGRETASRLLQRGMDVALLDVSKKELEETSAALQQEAKSAGKSAKVLAVICDVTSFDACQEAATKVAEAFPNKQISFLFNNAGISGQEGGKIIAGAPKGWTSVFSVNVFGAMHIIKSFLPGMVKSGPLKSGKKCVVATTSSVVGVLNHNLGPYSVSKMAVTAMVEQLSLELEGMGKKAAHVAPVLLLPTVCGGTDFLTYRGPDGSKAVGDEVKNHMAQSGGFTTGDIIDGFFKGLDDGKFYILVEHPLDIPSVDQIAMRFEDQIQAQKPRQPENLAMMLAVTDPKSFHKRKESMKQQRSKL